jgi:hypothetical protein
MVAAYQLPCALWAWRSLRPGSVKPRGRRGDDARVGNCSGLTVSPPYRACVELDPEKLGRGSLLFGRSRGIGPRL